MPLKQREIKMKITTGGDTRRGSGAYSVELAGHRTEAIVTGFGSGVIAEHLALRIFGMKQSDMDHFSTDAVNSLAVRNDIISVSAGDVSGRIQQVFEGTISSAVVNYDNQPEVSFDIHARSGFIHQVKPAAANSFEGAADVAEIVRSIAYLMGFAFINNGVTAKLSNQYLPGSLIQQLQKISEAAGIVIHVANGAVSIWPNNGGLHKNVRIAPGSGLVGYPSFTPTGVRVRMEFDPDFILGTYVDLTSSVKRANGRWRAQHVTHELSTLAPAAPWFTTADLTVQGLWIAA